MASAATPLRAAAYYRMSTLRQEDSVERQQSQVVPYAERMGYALAGEPYVDEGIAGNEIERRPAFQRLLRDAQRGLFEVILCDDKDRFGRFDSLELGEVAGPLRRKGVRLETVAQGRIDWNSFAGRITDAVLQEAKKMESQAISRRVLTTKLLRRSGANTPAVSHPTATPSPRWTESDSWSSATRTIWRWCDGSSTRSRTGAGRSATSTPS